MKVKLCKHCGCDPICPEKGSRYGGKTLYVTRCRNEHCAFHYVDFIGTTPQSAYEAWNDEQSDIVTDESEVDILKRKLLDYQTEYSLAIEEMDELYYENDILRDKVEWLQKQIRKLLEYERLFNESNDKLRKIADLLEELAE